MATLNPRSLIRTVFPTARRLLVERDIRRWCKNEHRRILVIGAGHDPYRRYFADAETYVALDVISFPGVTDVIADAVALPFGDETFDCVLAFEVMEHIADPMRLIKEAGRVLSPGGCFLLSVPFAFHQHGDPSDYWRPTRHSLEMATCAFKASEIYPQGNRFHVISDLITTAFHPKSVFWPLRILNHLFVRVLTPAARLHGGGSAPSGFFVVARK